MDINFRKRRDVVNGSLLIIDETSVFCLAKPAGVALKVLLQTVVIQENNKTCLKKK